MAITDELRRVAAKTECANGRCEKLYRGDLETIADRIDAEHAELAAKSDRQREQLAAMEDALRRRNEGELKRRWQREIDALRDERDELREAVRLSEAKASDMVELPKDADGEYIHIGDWMENGERVERIVLTDGSWEPYVYLAKTPYVLHEYFCNEISHYKQPTVEDVLTEFGIDWEHEDNCEDRAALLAEYAAKLRLAGDGE